MIGLIVTFIFLIIALFICILALRYFKKIQIIEIQQDKQIQKKQQLENQIKQKQNQIISLVTKEQDLKNNLKSVQKQITNLTREQDRLFQEQTQIIKKRVQEYKQLVDKSANCYIDEVEKRYEAADVAHAQKMASIKAEQDKAAAALNNLKETRKIAYERVLKQQEVKDNKDNYRLIPSSQDLHDARILENIKPNLNKQRILSMLIWQSVWQPIAKKQFPIILQDKTKTGIYRITNIQTDECYIGQAIDVYKRWCQHCKAGLGIDTPAGNKLYKAIQKYGLQNFTFELICECPKEQLNEKENYFIELYQSNLYGYNGNIGVKK